MTPTCLLSIIGRELHWCDAADRKMADRKMTDRHFPVRASIHLKFGFGVMNTSNVSLWPLEFFTPCGAPAGAITI